MHTTAVTIVVKLSLLANLGEEAAIQLLNKSVQKHSLKGAP